MIHGNCLNKYRHLIPQSFADLHSPFDMEEPTVLTSESESFND